MNCLRHIVDAKIAIQI